MSVDMYGAMTGAAAWMMTDAWDATHLALLFAMWTAMMAGMMLPSAAPALMLYGAVIRRSPDGGRAAAHIYSFAAGYLLVWTVFSLAATVLQRVLAHALALTTMMQTATPALAGGLLIAAGLYQLTPLKQACLKACRSPADFLTRHWRPGLAGGLWLGAANGIYCLGCCWALMLLLFVGGVMNLVWIAGLTIFVLLEKIATRGAAAGRISGAVLAVLGLALLARTWL